MDNPYWMIGVVGSCWVTLTGWLHLRMNSLATKINEVEKNKVSYDDFKETKDNIKEVLQSVRTIEIELAKWQGRAEVQEKNLKRS